MRTKEITLSKGDKNGTIESLIEFLEAAKKKGATHYNMRWSGDPNFDFKWFETYRNKSDEEVKQDEIKALQRKIDNLNNEKEN